MCHDYYLGPSEMAMSLVVKWFIKVVAPLSQREMQKCSSLRGLCCAEMGPGVCGWPTGLIGHKESIRPLNLLLPFFLLSALMFPYLRR